MTWFYRLFKIFIRSSLRLYFKQVRIEGLENIPDNAPLIFTPNHQNAIFDALIPGAFLPKTIHFITRSDVFVRRTKSIAALLNMIPIYRLRDGYSRLKENNETFKVCIELLRHGASILIFPEGSHGAPYYLRTLTKGTAKLAIHAQQGIEPDLFIVPIGLNYFSHQRPNHVVLMSIGRPIPVRDFVDNYTHHPAKTLIALRNAIAIGIKDQLAIPENSQDYSQKVAATFSKENEQHSLAKLKAIKAGKYTSIKKSKNHWLASVFNPFPFLVMRLVVKKVEDRVFHPSLKFIIGLASFPFWWAISFATASLIWNTFIGLGTVLLMILSLLVSYKW